MSATRRRPGPTVVGVSLATLEPTAVGVSQFSSCAPLGGGDSYRVNGPAAVGVAQ
jgi:hypothetical protein